MAASTIDIFCNRIEFAAFVAAAYGNLPNYFIARQADQTVLTHKATTLQESITDEKTISIELLPSDFKISVIADILADPMMFGSLHLYLPQQKGGYLDSFWIATDDRGGMNISQHAFMLIRKLRRIIKRNSGSGMEWSSGGYVKHLRYTFGAKQLHSQGIRLGKLSKSGYHLVPKGNLKYRT